MPSPVERTLVIETSTIFAVSVSAAVGGFVIAAAWHVWYALGLARVLKTNGVEPWRAWVPLLGDAEVMRLGRIDPVKVALLLVPLVAVYGVVLRALAAHRMNLRFGRGAGFTVLAVILPPVWAMVLAGAELVDADASDEDDDADEAPVVLVASGLVPVGLAPAALPPGAGLPAIAPPPAAWTPPPMLAPAGAPAMTPPAATPPITPPATMPAAAPAPPSAPVAPIPSTSAPAARRSEPSLPVSAALDAAPAEETSIRRRSRNAGDAASTIGSRSWELVLPSGEAMAITARTLVLGRKPQMRRGEAQYVTVADDTRTVSKEHAQLQWSDEGWMLTDLGSVNGVTLVDAQGVEHPVASGTTVRVEGVFLLGGARLGLRRIAGS